MLVTFKTTAYADITMFGDAATALLQLMGQSGNVPGAIMGEDVGEALDRLKTELANQPAEQQDDASSSSDDDDDSNKIALATRAISLLELLEAAAASKANVMWDN